MYKLDKNIYDRIKNGEHFYSVNPTKALYALLKILYLCFLFLIFKYIIKQIYDRILKFSDNDSYKLIIFYIFNIFIILLGLIGLYSLIKTSNYGINGKLMTFIFIIFFFITIYSELNKVSI